MRHLLVVAAVVLGVGCAAPDGRPCGVSVCEDSTTMLACVDGGTRAVLCHGPSGCTGGGAYLSCDSSEAQPGEACVTIEAHCVDGGYMACGGDGDDGGWRFGRCFNECRQQSAMSVFCF